MHQGNWKCSSCGGAITELPFQPRSESGLTCRTCYAKQKNKDLSNQPMPDMNVASAPQYDAPDFTETDFDNVASEPAPGDDFGTPVTSSSSSDKPKFSGSWQCAGCGAAITSLPFTPRDTSNLKCLDCFKRSKA